MASFDDIDIDAFRSKAVAKKPGRQETSVTMSSVSSKPAWKIEQMVDGDTGKPLAFTSKDEAKLIVQGRLARGLTQRDLATKLNMQVALIQDIEAGRAVDNRNHVVKICRFLGIGCGGPLAR